jgi:hypothetical protein
LRAAKKVGAPEGADFFSDRGDRELVEAHAIGPGGLNRRDAKNVTGRVSFLEVKDNQKKPSFLGALGVLAVKFGDASALTTHEQSRRVQQRTPWSAPEIAVASADAFHTHREFEGRLR